MSNRFNSEKHVNLVEEELLKTRKVIHNRNAVIRRLCEMLNSYGIEVSGLGDIDNEFRQ